MTSWASEPEDGPWAVRSARISLRLQPAALRALRVAAELRSQDLTSFVLGAALDRAADVVGRERNSRLQLALIAEDPARYRRDPRIPDDPDLWRWWPRRSSRGTAGDRATCPPWI